MKNYIFLQARINSTRLPHKILKQICGKTILELLVERLYNINDITKILLVTGSQEKNIELINKAKKLKLDFFCGNENNILDRFHSATQKFKLDNIIRVTGDCPLIDFNVINNGLEIFKQNNYDILSIDRVRTFPHGFDFEIFTKEALIRSWNNVLQKFNNKKDFDNTFISPAENMLFSNEFKNYDLINEIDFSYMRLTLDYAEDFELIKQIYESLYYNNNKFALKEITQLINEKPELLEINRKYIHVNKT